MASLAMRLNRTFCLQLKKHVSAELTDVSKTTERLLRRFHVAQNTCQELSEHLQGALKAEAARAEAYATIAAAPLSVSTLKSGNM
jgi:hypothetical protein